MVVRCNHCQWFKISFTDATWVRTIPAISISVPTAIRTRAPRVWEAWSCGSRGCWVVTTCSWEYGLFDYFNHSAKCNNIALIHCLRTLLPKFSQVNSKSRVYIRMLPLWHSFTLVTLKGCFVFHLACTLYAETIYEGRIHMTWCLLQKSLLKVIFDEHWSRVAEREPKLIFSHHFYGDIRSQKASVTPAMPSSASLGSYGHVTDAWFFLIVWWHCERYIVGWRKGESFIQLFRSWVHHPIIRILPLAGNRSFFNQAKTKGSMRRRWGFRGDPLFMALLDRWYEGQSLPQESMWIVSFQYHTFCLYLRA